MGFTAPAVGESKDLSFEFKFTVAPGARPVVDDDDDDAEHVDGAVGYTQTQKVTFTNLGDNPTLAGPLAISGNVDLAPLVRPPGATAITPRVEVATPYSGWMPLTVAGSPGGTRFSFSQGLPSRNDWQVRLSATGYESRVIALGNVNDPRPSLDTVLAPARSIDFEYVQRAAVATPTGFWRGAVSESEGTFVAFPGQETWPATTTEAQARTLRATGRIYKYRFDGTKVWEHAPGAEAWGGDMTTDGRFVAYALGSGGTSSPAPTENKLVLLDGGTGAVLWSKSSLAGDAVLGRQIDSLELAFSPDAKWIAVGSTGSGQVTLVDRATGNFAWTMPATGAPSFGQVRRLRFSPDARFLYCGSGDSQLRQLRVADGAVLWKAFAGGWPTLNGLDLTPDGSWLVAGTKSLDTTLVRTTDGRIEWQKESQFADAVFAPDGRHLVTAGGQIYRSVDGSLAGATRQTAPARFTPDGRYVIQIDRDLRLYDLGGSLLRTFSAAALSGPFTGAQWSYLTRDARFAIVLARDTASANGPGMVIFERAAATGSPPVAPAILAQPIPQTIALGATAALAVEATGSAPISYQWRRDAADLPGQNSPILSIASVSPADAASYSVRVTNAAGSISSTAATLTVTAPDAANPGRLANVSVRANVGVNPIILGFAVGGGGTTGTKTLLFRGSGPALAALDVPGTLPDPRLVVFDGALPLISNDSWFGDAQVTALAVRLGAFPFASALSKDAAIAAPLGGGSYTMQLLSNDGKSGIALAEIYDGSNGFAATTPRLVNISARGDAGVGDNALIAGLVITGPTGKTLLIRGVGPALAAYNVPNVLTDPQLTVYRDQEIIATNDNWYDAPNAVALSAAAMEAGAFALTPGSRDAGLLLTLPPGGYTVKVSSVTGQTGNALAEVYEVR